MVRKGYMQSERFTKEPHEPTPSMRFSSFSACSPSSYGCCLSGSVIYRKDHLNVPLPWGFFALWSHMTVIRVICLPVTVALLVITSLVRRDTLKDLGYPHR